jgi:hypothetical protein
VERQEPLRRGGRDRQQGDAREHGDQADDRGRHGGTGAGGEAREVRPERDGQQGEGGDPERDHDCELEDRQRQGDEHVQHVPPAGKVEEQGGQQVAQP